MRALRLVLFPSLAAVLLLSAGPAAAQPRGSAEAQLVRARDRFDYGDYADAVRIVRRLLDEGRLTSEQQLVEAHRLLGVSLFYAGDEEEARAAFVRLLSIEPDFRLDPFFHPPKLVEFFDAVRADNEALLAPLRDQRRLLEEQRRLEEEARRRLLEEEERRRLARRRRQEPAGEADMIVERVISNHTYVVNWLPFGSGQFQNQQPTKGAALATAQIITGAASVLGFAVVASASRCIEVDLPAGSAGEDDREKIVQCGIPPDSENLVRNMDRMKWVTGVMFWSLVGYGIIDAHLHYQPYKVVSERRIEAPRPPDGEEAETTGEGTSTGTDDPSRPSTRLDADPPRDHPRTPRALLDFGVSPWLSPDGAGAALTIRF